MANQEAVQAQAPTNKGVVAEKDMSASVLKRVEEMRSNGELQLPNNYSAPNALRAAWLQISNMTDRQGVSVLSQVTPSSVANTLMKMVKQGLNPDKGQCYFIKYGKDLTLMRSYQGACVVAKRNGMLGVTGSVVYKEDEFEFEVKLGRTIITKHVQKFDNIDDTKIIGAYATATMDDGSVIVDIMNISQIRKSWQQGQGEGPVHKNFPGEMCKKTVIARLCKNIINSSDDADLEEVEPYLAPMANTQQTIAEKANTVTLQYESAEITNVELETNEPLTSTQIMTDAETTLFTEVPAKETEKLKGKTPSIKASF
jgi:recombination protein RecT